MYLPQVFAELDRDSMHDLIEAYPFGTLVTATREGPFATHLPFVLERETGAWGVLRGHIARANPHHRLEATAAEALVMFMGPHAYVSPSHYASKAEHGRVVPTWNYVAVHAYGAVRFIDDRDFLLRNVEALTLRHEAGRERPWSIHDAPEAFVEGLTQAIVGIEIEISRLEGKWKMSQNREARDAEGVARGLASSEHPGERQVSRIVAERLAARRSSGAAATKPNPAQP